MIARNIAPGLMRSFSLEQFPCTDLQIVEDIHHQALQAQYIDKTFTLIGTDIDPEMIDIARENARNA